MPRHRLTVQEAAEVLGISVDAARMRSRRGSLDSEHEDGRLYIWLDIDSSETKHDVQGESDALISAKDETIQVLREQLEAERQAHSEARRLLAAALERIPEIEAPQEPAGEPREAPETASEGAQPRSTTEETEEPPQRRSWLYRFFFGPGL